MNKVVFFDLFNTLVNVDKGYLEKYFTTEIDRLGDMGILKTAGETIDELIKVNNNLLKEHTKEEMTEYYEKCMYNIITNVNTDIILSLIDLKTKGYKLCIISNAGYNDILGWKDSNLSLLFDETVFSCEVGKIKPSKEIYEIAIEKMNNPTTCIFVGDGGSDELFGAHNTGMITIKAEWFKKHEKEDMYKHSDYCIDNVKDLVRVIEGISNMY